MEQNFHYFLAAATSSIEEQGSAVSIGRIRINVVPPDQYFHHSLSPLKAAYKSSIRQYSFSMSVWRRFVRAVFSPLLRAHSNQLTRAVFGCSYPVCQGWRRLLLVVFIAPLPRALPSSILMMV